MTKLLLTAGVPVVALFLLLSACSPQDTSTTSTTVAKAGVPQKATQSTEPASSTTTGTTQALVVWQTIRYEQNTPGMSYSGRWIYASADAASEGGFVYADSEGATLTFRFVGTYCGWLAKTSNLYGKAKITVDDASTSSVDLYSKEALWCHLVWETKSLPFGEHTVKIEWTGKKRSGSKGTHVNLDAVEIVGALIGRYEQGNSHLEYEGKWRTSKNESASGGSFALTKSSRSSVTVNFTGIQLDWYAKEGPAYGKAEVIVDEGDPQTVDLYSADQLWNRQVWSSGRLDMGPHTVVIRWTGAKNPAATSTYINVDAFELYGALGALGDSTDTTEDTQTTDAEGATETTWSSGVEISEPE